MTCYEAYTEDLNEIQTEVAKLLSLVPAGKTKSEKAARAQAEEIASRIKTTAHLMKKDYIIEEA